MPALASAFFNLGSIVGGLALGFWIGPSFGLTPIGGMAIEVWALRPAATPASGQPVMLRTVSPQPPAVDRDQDRLVTLNLILARCELSAPRRCAPGYVPQFIAAHVVAQRLQQRCILSETLHENLARAVERAQHRDRHPLGSAAGERRDDETDLHATLAEKSFKK